MSDWRKSSEDEKSAQLESLLSYQGEINKLSARAKFAEGAFVSLYNLYTRRLTLCLC